MDAPTPRAGFAGAKIAVVADGAVLTLKRDAIDTIPDPGLWDLPGGGREGAEGPVACALRELHEEFGLVMAPARIAWRCYSPRGRGAWFFGAYWSGLDPRAVRFGAEGQAWALMPVAEFLSRADVVPRLQGRLSAFLARA